ncbi:MAG: MerR family transcriptional regulator [Caulobacter sp.]|nr:MerR family transcriptional regulator [Caulobacter sp.]
MIARSDYVGPITKSAEAMFARAERLAISKASKPMRRSARRPKSPTRQALEALGVSPAVLRGWEGAGIVELPRIGGRRVIDQESIDCITVIMALRRAGFTIREISWISDTLPPSAAAMKQALQARLDQVQTARDVSIARVLVAGRVAA